MRTTTRPTCTAGRTAGRTVGLAAASVAAATLLALGGAAPALAATSMSDPGTTTAATAPTAAVLEPGHLSLGSSSAAPGSSITFSGTCPTQAGPGFPTITSVTSSAFSSSQLGKTDPYAFTGTATIAADAAPGTYTVTAQCSNGTATASLTVTGGHATPAHGGSHGTGGGGAGMHAGATGVSDTTPGASAGGGSGDLGVVDLVSSDGDSALPWVLGGLAALGVVGAGAYGIGRGRTADRAREELAARSGNGAGTGAGGADAPTQRMDVRR